MSQTWTSDTPPDAVKISPAGYCLAILRGVPLAVLVFGGLAIHLLVRLIEYPFFRQRRPWTPWITQFVCRNALRILGLSFRVSGEIMPHHGALVANHSTWLDIFTLNAAKRIYFVSKSEVSGWPGIGWLAKATGTLFIDRNPRHAKAQSAMFQWRLKLGHRLLFFPEGTSTDGLRVLPFRSTLFAAFFEEDLRDEMWIQPISAIYTAPKGAPARFYGWWGDMDFASDLLKVLAQSPQGSVEIVYHPALRVLDYPNRKSLCAAAEEAVRSAFLSPPQ